MRGMVHLKRAACLLAIAAAGLAVAAPLSEKKPRAMGIDGVKTAPPVIVATEPRAGADDVDPALTEIKITFSKDMQNGSWAFAQVSKEMFPETTGKPHYLDDKRTCVLPVKLEPGKTYILALNKPPFDSFMDTEKRKAMEYMLVFETKK